MLITFKNTHNFKNLKNKGDELHFLSQKLINTALTYYQQVINSVINNKIRFNSLIYIPLLGFSQHNTAAGITTFQGGRWSGESLDFIWF